MKKQFLLISLAGFLFSSCVWYPVNNLSEIRNKNTYTAFDDLNTPIVFTVPITQKFIKKGQSNYTSETIGSAYVIYDWETDKIHDYVFQAGSDLSYSSIGVLPCIEKSNGQPMYVTLFSSEDLGVLKLKSTETKTDIKEYPGAGSYTKGLYTPDNFAVKNGLYVKKNDYNNTSRNFECGLSFFNADSEAFINIGSCLMSYSSLNYFNCCQDGNGNYWFLYEYLDSENHKSLYKIRSINGTTNKIDDDFYTYDFYKDAVYDEYGGWNKYADVELLAVTDKFIFTKQYEIDESNKNEVIKLVALDRISKTDYQINLPADYCYQMDLIELNGKMYLFLISEYNQNADVYTVLDDLTLSPIISNVPLMSLHQTIVRGNRVYFTDKYISSTINMQYFDSDTNTMSSLKSISISDF